MAPEPIQRSRLHSDSGGEALHRAPAIPRHLRSFISVVCKDTREGGGHGEGAVGEEEDEEVFFGPGEGDPDEDGDGEEVEGQVCDDAYAG